MSNHHDFERRTQFGQYVSNWRSSPSITRKNCYWSSCNTEYHSGSPIIYSKKSQKGIPGTDRNRINANYRNKRVCWGCGSTEDLLSDKKCALTPNTTKIHLDLAHYASPKQVHFMQEELVTLYSTSQIETAAKWQMNRKKSEYFSVADMSYGLQPSQIWQQWSNFQKIKKFSEKSRTRVVDDPGRKLENLNLENGSITVIEAYFGWISVFIVQNSFKICGHYNRNRINYNRKIEKESNCDFRMKFLLLALRLLIAYLNHGVLHKMGCTSHGKLG